MRNRNIILFLLFLIISTAVADPLCEAPAHNLEESALAKELGWIPCNENRCGGFYLESPFIYSDELVNTDKIEVTANQMLFAQHGTSIGQGKVTITRSGQQIIANKAYLYRDPVTGKLSSIDLIDNVTLHEPDSL